MTPAQAPRATAIRTEYDRAVDEHSAARRDLAAARRRLQQAARIREALEREARRLGLELIVTRRSQPGGTDR